MHWWHKYVRPLAWAVLILLLARVGLRAAIQSVTEPAGRPEDIPTAMFDQLEQGVVVAGAEGEAAADFHVRNTGQHRLVVRLQRRACCDPPSEPLVLAPGESGTLTVRAPVAELLKRSQFRQAVTTNDPSHPEFWLTVKLANEPTPALREASAAATGAVGHSVLVNRP